MNSNGYSLIDPSLDGIDHINIYSKGRTSLGRDLTNFAHTPFIHPEYGSFESIEGFWFWFKCFHYNHKEHDILKTLHGYKAKEIGSSLFEKIDSFGNTFPASKDDIYFQEQIINGIKIKLRTHKNILNELVATDLPLKHYYLFNAGKANQFVKELPEYQWLVDGIEDIRSIAKNFLLERNKSYFN